MKRLNFSNLFVATLLTGSGMMLAGCPGEDAKKAVSKMTEATVGTLKGAAAGVAEGVDEGRKQVVGSDGAIILSTAADLNEKLSVEILGFDSQQNHFYPTVTVGFVNVSDQKYRVTNIFGNGNVLLLDKDGYVSENVSYSGDVTIPPRAKNKATLKFDTSELSTLTTIRVFGVDYPLPQQAGEMKVPIQVSLPKPAVAPAPDESK